MAEIHRQVEPSGDWCLIFDAGNVICQGFTPADVLEQYLAMKPGLGWMHIKDYRHPRPTQRQAHVDEEALKHFVPADVGDSAYETILRDFRDQICRSWSGSCDGAASPACFWIWSRTSRAAGNSAASADPTGWGLRCAACAKSWTMSQSATTCAISRTSATRAASESGWRLETGGWRLECSPAAYSL